MKSKILTGLLCLFALCSCRGQSGVRSVYLHDDLNAVIRFFESQPGGVLTLDAVDPGKKYAYEISEKHSIYASDENALRFTKVVLRLRDRMPPGTLLADATFIDGVGTRVDAESIDLMKLAPRLETTGDMQYVDFILKEFERFGFSFRREHGEFSVVPGSSLPAGASAALDQCYRLSVVNNCLDPTKWEMELTAEDYSDFNRRLASPLYLTQDRRVSHSWFYIPRDLYETLLRLKNPGLSIDPFLNYDEMNERAQQVSVDWSRLRTVLRREPAKILEVGHRSGRKIEPLDDEEYYKAEQGLIVNRSDFTTYSNVLDQPVRLARFSGRGYYSTKEPREFDYAWMRSADDVVLETLKIPQSEAYVQITVTGRDSPYEITAGNIDLALLSEQDFLDLPFGINPNPVSRRHNPIQDTIRYEVDRMPANIRPYMLMTDRGTGQWVNNQDHGLEKLFIGWETMKKNVIVLYLISYERIMPVWMARVKIDDSMVDRVRVRRAMRTY